MLRFSLVAALAVAAPGSAQPVSEILGVAHAAGRYNFTEEDYLNEGADLLLAMGTRVIKVFVTPDPASAYPFNSDWEPLPLDAADLVSRPYFQELFAKPFSTFILVFTPALGPNPYLDGMDVNEINSEWDQAYRLTAYLLRTYAGSGKRFVLQNWEGDHLLRAGLPPHATPDPVRVAGMIDWLNARQDGVEAARREVGEDGVEVDHAIEANLVLPAMEGKVTLANDVVPHTRADLYSYSSWETFRPTKVLRALNYLRAKAPDSPRFGAENVYVGEFGASKHHAGNEKRQGRLIGQLADAVLGWGARWAVYWQVYCNEADRVYQGRPRPRDLRGFWLIRPDGWETAMWKDFKRRLAQSRHRVALANYAGRYVGPEGDAEQTVSAGRWRQGPGAVLTLLDLDGGDLASGDEVAFLTGGGRYVTAEPDGRLTAASRRASEAATFRLYRASGSGTIRPGDAVHLKTAYGRFVGAPLNRSALQAGRFTPGPAETFTLLPAP
jgi:hypothetical protein